MKNTISKKIIKVILIPFLIIFGVLMAFVLYSVTQYVKNWTELELKGISEINAADLAGRMHSVQVSVLSAADVLDILSTRMENDREIAESIVKSLFKNQYVYNAWLACEPDAFDGKDADYKSDYPGAPSGRFIRSYIFEDGQIIVAPDMDENTLDNPDESPWYVVPRDTDDLYIDIDNDIPNLYDYGLGSEPVYTLSIVAPIHKDGRVIGCVGADVLFDVTKFGIDNSEQAAVAVFYPNGRLFYSVDLALAEESVDTLRFTDTAKIKEAISGGQSLFLPNEYSIFLDTNAFTYFQPVGDSDSDKGSLFLYTAKPVSSAYKSLSLVFILIGTVTVAVLILGFSVFLYLKRKISKPLESLTLAADAISQGDLEVEISSFTNAKDEIGILSRSLNRMVEQFRVYIIRMEQTQGEMSVFSQLDGFMKSDNTTDALNELSDMLCQQFGMSKMSAVFIDGGRARVFSRFDCESGADEFSSYPDFMYHTQAKSMLGGKKLLYMNTSTIAQSGAEFLDSKTLAACIVPIWAENDLCGYIIFESDNKNQTVNVITESILAHVARTLANWWINKKEQQPTSVLPLTTETKITEITSAEYNNTSETKSETPDVSQESVFKGIAGLDSDSAIAAMGGLSEIYEQSVKLMTRLLPETVEKLDLYLPNDLKAFAIEIHGLKGSLNNIGAYELGSMASHIEQMAKAGDADGCTFDIPSFKESLSELHRGISGVLESAEDKPPGNKDILADALEKTDEALRNFDTLEALDLMQPLASYSYDAETETIISEIIFALETFDSEKASINIQKLRGIII